MTCTCAYIVLTPYWRQLSQLTGGYFPVLYHYVMLFPCTLSLCHVISLYFHYYVMSHFLVAAGSHRDVAKITVLPPQVPP